VYFSLCKNAQFAVIPKTSVLFSHNSYISLTGPVREIADNVFVVSFLERGLSKKSRGIGLEVSGQRAVWPVGSNVSRGHDPIVTPGISFKTVSNTISNVT